MSNPFKRFECQVTETRHGRDADDYPTAEDETWVESYGDINQLAMRLAEIKQRETPEDDRLFDYITVSFGCVREILVLNEEDLAETLIKDLRTPQKIDHV